MNSYQPSTKYQDDCDYGNPARHSSSRNLVSKHTNTPYEFMICLRCQEKISKNSQQFPNNSVGDCERSMSDYSKALNYINSCHTIINQMMTHTKISGEFITMPDLPNFMDLFHTLTSCKTICSNDTPTSKRTTHESRCNSRQASEERSRNNSDENHKRGGGSKLYPGRPQNREQLRQTTKGRFIELLPEVKHDNYNKQETFSPGTTESEESDLELNMNIQKTSRIAMPLNKYKSKIKTTHEKVIYEEDSHEDDSVNLFKKKENKLEKKIKDDNTHNKKTLSPGPSERPRSVQGSPVAPRPKSILNSSPPMICSSPIHADNTKKVKQRSSSSVTPREKLKSTIGKKGGLQEIGGNFSDTAITAGSIVGQIKKIGSKTLCSPIDIRNNELSQQDLDKYAKELLGSETPRSPRSKSPTAFRSSSLEKSKIEQERGKKFQKPFPSPTMKSHASEQKRRCSQEKPSSNSNMNVNAKSSVNTQQQKQEQQPKKFRKSYSPQPVVEQMPAKKNAHRKSNLTGPNQNQGKICNNYGFGAAVNQCCASDTNYVRNRIDKSRNDKMKSAVEIQEEERIREVPEENEDVEEESCSSPENLNLLCDNIETLSMHSRSGSQDRSIPKVQYSVMEKPRDFFTTNRKSVRMRRNEYDIESDIKTDSDIEEDHFEKDGVPLSRKSSKSNEARVQMSEVLSRLGLFQNQQMPPETEQLINEAKSTRANDERNRPFREPRKVSEDGNEGIMKIDENRVDNNYSTESFTHLHRTISEESSDIKSDEEIYNNSNDNPQKSYNYCMGNNRYQT